MLAHTVVAGRAGRRAGGRPSSAAALACLDELQQLLQYLQVGGWVGGRWVPVSGAAEPGLLGCVDGQLLLGVHQPCPATEPSGPAALPPTLSTSPIVQAWGLPQGALLVDPLLAPHSDAFSGCLFQCHLVQGSTGSTAVVAAGGRCAPGVSGWVGVGQGVWTGLRRKHCSCGGGRHVQAEEGCGWAGGGEGRFLEAAGGCRRPASSCFWPAACSSNPALPCSALLTFSISPLFPQVRLAPESHLGAAVSAERHGGAHAADARRGSDAQRGSPGACGAGQQQPLAPTRQRTRRWAWAAGGGRGVRVGRVLGCSAGGFSTADPNRLGCTHCLSPLSCLPTSRE